LDEILRKVNRSKTIPLNFKASNNSSPGQNKELMGLKGIGGSF